MVSSGTPSRPNGDGGSIAVDNGCRGLTTGNSGRIVPETFRMIVSRSRAARLGNGYLAP
jgi:hypothetical protein